MCYYKINTLLIIIQHILQYCKSFRKESDILAIAGIVAEFNPLHNGHKHLIDCAKKDGNTVVCVISGNFVQRGDTAVIPKFRRAEAALSAGADIVIELPVPWSMSTAQNFALGAMSQLKAFNISSLYFGSEAADVDMLLKTSDLLCTADFNEKIRAKLKNGETFAKSRYDVISSMLDKECSVLDTPNDTLAVEYINAAKKLNMSIAYQPIKRIGADHDQAITSSENFASSSLLRKYITDNNFASVKGFLPNFSYEITVNSPISSISHIDNAITAVLKRLNNEDFKKLPDISEGIENLIYENVHSATDFNELCMAVKSKRYTLARVRRLLLSAFLGIDNRYFLTEPPYVRILGMSEQGAKAIKKNPTKQIVTRASEIRSSGTEVQELFELENRINELYALSLDEPKRFLNESSERIICKHHSSK